MKRARTRTDTNAVASAGSESDVDKNLCFALTALNDTFLDPLDLIRLMCVSKATRRVVAPILNKLENDVIQTRAHTEMFRSEYGDKSDRFAILEYKRTYHCEQSKVAIFDGSGEFIAFYEFKNNYICAAQYGGITPGCSQSLEG